MIPKFRFWHIAEEKMHDVLSVHLMTGMVEVESGKYFLIPQEGFLMQSTGLKDKNGKEIFEGDVIAGGRVTYLPQFGSWMVVFTDSDSEDLCDFTSAYEVTGNIYENPELVEVG